MADITEAYQTIGHEWSNDDPNSTEQQFALEALPNGGYVMAWVDGNSGTNVIWAQIFDAVGAPVGQHFLVAPANPSAYENKFNVQIEILSSGDFVIAWDQPYAGTYSILARAYDQSGNALSSPFLAGNYDYDFSSASYPDLLAAEGNQFWVISNSQVPYGSYGLFAQRVDSTGTVLSARQVVSYSDQIDVYGAAEAVPLADGRFVVTWREYNKSDTATEIISARIFDSNFQAVSQTIEVSNLSFTGGYLPLEIEALPSGGFAVTWREYHVDTGAYSANLRFFDALGSATGPVLVLDASSHSGDSAGIALLSDGNILVSWSEYGADVLVGQILDASGNAIGIPFPLTTTDNQHYAQVVALAGGGFAAGYLGSIGGSDWAIQSRAFASGTQVGTEGEDIIVAKQGTIGPIDGLGGRDYIGGNNESNVLRGGTGSDTLAGGMDDDELDGGSGHDIGVFSGNYVGYTIDPIGPHSYLVTDIDPTDGDEGHDMLFSIEELRFADISVTLEANRAPEGTPTTVLPNGTEDVPYIVSTADLLAGFTDPDEDTIQVVNISASNGIVTYNYQDSSYTVTPFADVYGPATLSYDVIDGNGGSISANISYALASVNDPPTGFASAVLGEAAPDAPYIVSASDLLMGFRDADGDPLIITSLVASSGVIADNGDGSYTITQAPDVVGLVTLDYIVTDGQGGVAPARQFYSIAASNHAPILSAIQGPLANGLEDVAYVVSAADLLAGFTDVDGDVLSVSGLSASSGTVIDNGDGSFTISQATNFNGSVTLTYNVTDGRGGSADGSRSYTLAAVSDAPTGSDNTVTIAEDSRYVFSWNDFGYSDPDNSPFPAIRFMTVPTQGTLYFDTDGAGGSLGTTITPGYAFGQAGVETGWLVYVPATDSNGSVTFSFKAIESGGAEASASNTFTFNITPVNDAPVNAVPGIQTIAEDGTLVFSTANGNTITTSDVDNGPGGITVTVQAAGNIYVQGALVQSGIQGLPGNFSSTVLINGNGSSVVTIGGLVADVNKALEGLTYRPPADYNGTVTFTVTSNDHGATGSGGWQVDADTFNIKVTPVNDAPTGSATISGSAVQGATLSVSNTLIDADGIGTFWYQWYQKDNGIAIAGANSSTYTLTQADVGHQIVAAVRYTDAHGQEESVDSAPTALVANVNDAPQGISLSGGAVAENAANGTVVGTFAGLDIDVGDTLTYSLLSNAGGRFTIGGSTGQLTVAAGNLLDYEAAQSYQLTVRVTDAALANYDQTFTVNLTNVVENQTVTLGATQNFSAVSNDNWQITGGTGANQIMTLGGNDRISGGAGDDAISTDGGADTITFQGAGSGFDSIDGGAGNDTILALSNNTVIGLKSVTGIETISAAGLKGVYIQGSAGNETFDFSATSLLNIDSIRGGDGSDTIIGSNGADVILGEGGRDQMRGNGGADRFVFSTVAEIGMGATADQILDFQKGSDRIDLSAIDADSIAKKDQQFNFIGANAFHRVAGELRVTIDGNGTGHLAGDIDGDGAANFEIMLLGLGGQAALANSDFIL